MKGIPLILGLFFICLAFVGCSGPVGGEPVTVYTTTNYYVSTFMGYEVDGTNNIKRQAVVWNIPSGITFDPEKNLIVADYNNKRIRKIGKDGSVSTIVGLPANLQGPLGISFDSYGDLIICDEGGHRIKKVSKYGFVTTIVGTGALTTTEGTAPSVGVYYPENTVFDSKGNMYYTDYNASVICKLTPEGKVTLFVGRVIGTNDGVGTNAQLRSPVGMVIDSKENIFIADSGNNAIRKVTLSGEVTTFAGSANSGVSGTNDGVGSVARFNRPTGLVLDSSDNLYVTDNYGVIIRRITPQGVVTTIAGSGANGTNDGPGRTAKFNSPFQIAVDDNGNLYVTEVNNNKIRFIKRTIRTNE